MQQAPEMLSFQKQQFDLTAHLRDPDHAAGPSEIEDRRLAIYRNLIYNNLEGFVSNNFPVMRTLFADEPWHAMVRDFFIKHRAHTPYFSQIAQEFIAYLSEERDAPSDPPFLLELAHYEWIELELTLDENEVLEISADPNGDLLSGVPVLSPLTRALSYHYPVHQISEEFQPNEPGSELTHLIVYRDREDNVGFLEANAVTQRLLQLIGDNQQNASGAELLTQLATELGYTDPKPLLAPGLDILTNLRHRDILLGTQAT